MLLPITQDIQVNESILNLTQIEEQNESHVVNTGDLSPSKQINSNIGRGTIANTTS